MSGRKIALGWCRPPHVSGRFMDSLIQTINWDWNNERLIRGRTIRVQSGPGIDLARNQICAEFLHHPDRPDWLLMVDADMEWDPDVPHRLLQSAHPKDSPIVGALCHALDSEGKPYPTLYHLTSSGPEVIRDYPDGLCKVTATGAAFLLIHRSALERIRNTDLRSRSPWFAFSHFPNGQHASEDWTFCLRAQKAGIPIFVQTLVRVGHIKEQVI